MILKKIIFIGAFASVVFCEEDSSLVLIEKSSFEVCNSKTKEVFLKKLKTYREKIKNLSEKDKRILYSRARKNLQKENIEDPFAGQEMYLIIGLILETTEDYDLKKEILVYTPPVNVGSVTLSKYLNEVNKELLADVLFTSSKLLQGRAGQAGVPVR